MKCALPFINEVALITNKFKSAGYPVRFVNSVIHEFTTTQANEDIEFITPWLFEVKKKMVLLETVCRMKPHCLKNESSSKQFRETLISLLTIRLMCE